MRIAFIGQKSIVLGQKAGGIETHVAKLAPKLVEAGHEVTVYARKRYSKEHPTYMEGVRLRYPKTIYTKNLEAGIHTIMCTLDVLRRKVDVIHYHGVGPSLMTWIPRLLRPSATVVSTFHAQDRLHQKWGLVARTMLHIGEWMACRIPHATISVSHGLQVYCRDKYGAEVIFIPNGADRKTVRESNELAKFGLRKKEYVMYAGRLLKVKGLHHLIKAFRTIKTDKDLVIVGAPALNDSYLDELKKLAKGKQNIKFTGFQSGDALEQLFAHAYLYCQPSESEGLPLTVLEAMSFGTAVLVSDIPGNLEAIHRSGHTFENKNVDDLRAQLELLLKHPEEVTRSVKAQRKVIDKYFAWDRIVERTLEVYRSARH